MKGIFRIASMVAMAVGLAGCGGGGSSTVDTATGYPLDAAMSAFFQAQHNYILTASNASDHYTLVRGWTPGPMKSFQGQSADTLAQSAALTDNGSAVFSDVQTKFFLLGPYILLGSIDANGEVFVNSNQVALPDLASIGDSGKFETATAYTDASLSTVLATFAETWTLTAVTADTAMLCFKEKNTTSGATAPDTSLCYIMDQRGNVTGVDTTFTVKGVQLTFK